MKWIVESAMDLSDYKYKLQEGQADRKSIRLVEDESKNLVIFVYVGEDGEIDSTPTDLYTQYIVEYVEEKVLTPLIDSSLRSVKLEVRFRYRRPTVIYRIKYVDENGLYLKEATIKVGLAGHEVREKAESVIILEEGGKFVTYELKG